MAAWLGSWIHECNYTAQGQQWQLCWMATQHLTSVCFLRCICVWLNSDYSAQAAMHTGFAQSNHAFCALVIGLHNLCLIQTHPYPHQQTPKPQSIYLTQLEDIA